MREARAVGYAVLDVTRSTPFGRAFSQGAFFVFCALGLAGCSGSPLPFGATLQGRSMHDLWIVFMWSGLGVMAIVYALIFWCVVRYRKRATDTAYPGQFRRNNRMEVVYTTVPILMVIALFAITYPAERHVETIAASQDVIVDVTGYRWSWRFAYPQLGVQIAGAPTANATTANGGPTLYVPVNATTRFDVTSVDVDHSFWVPAFLFKRDAIPGLQNVFDWTPDREGSYRGECAEFCGLDHANMGFTVRVVSRAAFDRWIASQKRVALQAAR